MLSIQDMEAEVKGLIDAKEEMQRRLQTTQTELERLDEELRKEAPFAEADESEKERFHKTYESRAQKRRETETLASAIQGLEREISARRQRLGELRHEAGDA